MAFNPISPFWLANKEYSVLLGRKSVDTRSFRDSEWCNFVLSLEGRVFWRSPEFLANKLELQEFQIPIPSSTRRLTLSLEFKKFLGTQSFVISQPVPAGLPRRRRTFRGSPVVHVKFVIIGRGKKYLRSRQIARLRTTRLAKASRTVRSPYVRSSNVRASPESSFRPFTRVHELWNGSSWSQSSSVQAQLAYQRTWSGVRTPGFGSVRKKALPVNPHSVFIKTVNSNISLTSNQFVNGSGGDNWTRQYTEIFPEPSPLGHSPQARNLAIRKLIDNAQLGIQANLAQDLAQFGQTFGLIATNATKIVKSLRQLKRGNIPGAVSTLVHGHAPSRFTIKVGKPSLSKSLASNWLEVQYGWKPLLQDIEGALQALSNSKLSGFVSKVVAVGHSRSEDQSSWPPNQTGFSSSIAIKRWSETTCRFVLRYRLSDPLKNFLAQTGFTNPVNLAWEILPFSFVADWFLPIGPYLEGLSAFDGLDFLDGSQTLFTKGQAVSAFDGAGLSSGNSSITLIEHDAYHAEHVMLDRVKLNAFPSQTFPSFKNGFASVTHAANAIALLKANFS